MPASYDELRDVYDEFGVPDQYYSDYGFDKFVDMYTGSGASQEDSEADQDMFYQMLNAFVPEDEPQTAEYWEEIRQEFYDLAEITGDEIDWEDYREAIGYGESE